MAAKKAKTSQEATATAVVESNAPRPRLNKLIVRNFRCIGSEPVCVELDDIVVLVGANNAGKSSILRAYEVVMLHGSKQGELTIDDFPNGRVDSAQPPTIELETVVFDKTAPGDRWVRTDTASGDMFVREKWTWVEPGAPKKVGWEVAENKWHDSEGPWGAANVAQARRPEPHRVGAFDSPEKQAEETAKLLKEALTARVKVLSKQKADGQATLGQSAYFELMETVRKLQKEIAEDAKKTLASIETELSKTINSVFPGYAVSFDARAEDDIEKCINLFKADPIIRMGLSGDHHATIDRQGSGARRTLLWAALRILSEQRQGKDSQADKPHVLLMDEPEICLHPDAIREACRVLYDLPKNGNWQVMVTTHSPVFIDLSRDNTSIVRVERKTDGSVQGTTIFRPRKAHLSDDDKECLKLLNLCDPYVAEFFFGGRTILVEGDTEYTAFTYVIQREPLKFKNLHIVRARGKATIRSLCKILNQFDASYAVLHDSDMPTVKRKEQDVTNPAWTLNSEIFNTAKSQIEAGKARLLASLPNFELAYFGEDARIEKPFTAWERLKKDTNAFEKISALLKTLIDETTPVPDGAIAWTDLKQLEDALRNRGFLK